MHRVLRESLLLTFAGVAFGADSAAVRQIQAANVAEAGWSCSALTGTYLSTGTSSGTSGRSTAELRDLLFKWAAEPAMRLVLLNAKVKFVRLMADTPGHVGVVALDAQRDVIAEMALKAGDGWTCQDGRFRKSGQDSFAVEGTWGETKWSNQIHVERQSELTVSQRSVTTRRSLFSFGFGDDVVTEWIARFPAAQG